MKYRPSDKDYEQGYDFGRLFAQKVREYHEKVEKEVVV